MRIIFHKSGFTLVEILIVIALIALIASSVPITLNFRKQIDRSNDLKRKKELTMLRGAFDEYYTDNNNKYPTATNICSESTFPVLINGAESCLCHICGKRMVNPTAEQRKMFAYMKEIPCDPSSGGPSSPQQYFYNYDCDSTNPQWYRIYTILSNPDDLGARETGCGTGCGWDKKYNYGVGSPNVLIE